MRKLLIVLAIPVVCCVLVVVAWKAVYPTYVHRYRLTLEIEADGKIHTGSSVIEVRWEGAPKIGDNGSFGSRVFGQATIVDLGARGVIVATLFTGSGWGIAPDGAVEARFLGARAFGNDSTHKNLPALERLTGRRYLSEDNMPRLLWFKDPADIKSAQIIKAEDIPKLFGPDAKLKSAYVEITRDPIVVNIGKKLPWYSELEKRQKAKGVLSRADEFVLIYEMFGGQG